MSYASENSITSFEEVQKEVHKLLKAMQERWDNERRENESLKKEFERMKSENMVAKRSRLAEDVYDILMERVRRGGGETSLKEIFDELRSRNDELAGEKRELESKLQVLGKKYTDLDQRLLQLEKETSM